MATFQPKAPKNTAIVCPNHSEPLEGLPNPLPSKGEGMCPISGAMFAYEVDLESGETTYIKDKNGNLVPVPTYKVTGEEK